MWSNTGFHYTFKVLSHEDTPDMLPNLPSKCHPVEVQEQLPHAVTGREQQAQEKYNEILRELVDSEKEYVKSLGNIQVNIVI